MDLLHWVSMEFPEKHDRIFAAAAKHGHLDLLNKFQLDIMRSGRSKQLVQYGAAKGGQLEVLKWCKELGDLSTGICYKAVFKGQLEVAKWFLEMNRANEFCSCFLTNKAAEKGHLEMVKWLLKLAQEDRWRNRNFNEWTCVAATQGGHLEILKMLRQNGCGWNQWVCLTAARNGHLEVLKWARENGAPWDLQSCAGWKLRIYNVALAGSIVPIAASGQWVVL